MLGQLAHRLATGALTLLLVTGLVSVLIHLAPGDPLGDSLESAGMHRLPPAARAELERIYHLDQPLHTLIFGADEAKVRVEGLTLRVAEQGGGRGPQTRLAELSGQRFGGFFHRPDSNSGRLLGLSEALI